MRFPFGATPWHPTGRDGRRCTWVEVPATCVRRSPSLTLPTPEGSKAPVVRTTFRAARLQQEEQVRRHPWTQRTRSITLDSARSPRGTTCPSMSMSAIGTTIPRRTFPAPRGVHRWRRRLRRPQQKAWTSCRLMRLPRHQRRHRQLLLRLAME